MNGDQPGGVPSAEERVAVNKKTREQFKFQQDMIQDMIAIIKPMGIRFCPLAHWSTNIAVPEMVQGPQSEIIDPATGQAPPAQMGMKFELAKGFAICPQDCCEWWDDQKNRCAMKSFMVRMMTRKEL